MLPKLTFHGIISPPENDSFRKDFCFVVVFSHFSPSCNLRAPWADRREILHDAPKYIQFYNPGPKFWGTSQKIFRGQKHAKFGPISIDFEVWRRISPKRINIFKIGELLVRQRFLPRQAKKVRWRSVQQPWRSRCEFVPTESAFFGMPYFGVDKNDPLDVEQKKFVKFRPLRTKL